jgi:hypothetical protein
LNLGLTDLNIFELGLVSENGANVVYDLLHTERRQCQRKDSIADLSQIEQILNKERQKLGLLEYHSSIFVPLKDIIWIEGLH